MNQKFKSLNDHLDPPSDPNDLPTGTEVGAVVGAEVLNY